MLRANIGVGFTCGNLKHPVANARKILIEKINLTM
jgi:hypothetical protein